MSLVEYLYPVALLIGLDGYERIVRVPESPPPESYVPIPAPWSLSPADEPPRFTLIARRTFRLSRSSRSPSHRWWRVYNEGRSQTPEPAYVYFEVEPAEDGPPS